MRNQYIILSFCTILGAFLWMSSTGGAANVQGADLTGSPLSSGFCSGCHSGGNFSPSVSAELLDAGVAVSQYQPGKSYTLRIRVNTAGSPARFGFQAVALSGADNVKAGTFGTAPSGFRKTVLQDREYVEHSSPRASNTLEIQWTAPAASGESVRFYVSGIAANNNGSSSGDGSARLSQPLQINPMVTSTRESQATKLALKILGNPIEHNLNISLNIPETGQYRFSLLGIEGKTYWQRGETLQSGENRLQWELPQFPSGTYILKVEQGKNLVGTVKVIRK
jgi:hypothetical protein